VGIAVSRAFMNSRALLRVLGVSAAAAALLVLLAPWLNPCIGAIRYADCIDPKLVSEAEAMDPALWCYWGICDWFPSAQEKLWRIAAVLLVLAGAVALSVRLAKEQRMQCGVLTSIVTMVLAIAATWYLYPYATA